MYFLCFSFPPFHVSLVIEKCMWGYNSLTVITVTCFCHSILGKEISLSYKPCPFHFIYILMWGCEQKIVKFLLYSNPGGGLSVTVCRYWFGFQGILLLWLWYNVYLINIPMAQHMDYCASYTKDINLIFKECGMCLWHAFCTVLHAGNPLYNTVRYNTQCYL